MKKNLSILVFLILITFESAALEFYKDAPLIDHLKEVNINWADINSDFLNVYHRFNSEEDRISTHLQLVIGYLKVQKNHGLDFNQMQKRMGLLNALQVYALKRVYPKNIYHDHRIPYFIDHNNTACAVGYMIRHSGNDNIGQWVKSKMNNAYLAEIPVGSIDQWAMEFGFTRDELAWIQPGYVPDLSGWTALQEGINGPAKTLIEYNDELIIAGQFNDASGTAVNNVVSWNGMNYSTLGDGVNGKVNTSIIFGTELYLGGVFNGGANDIAIWDGTSWVYQTAFSSKSAEVFEFEIHQEQLYTSGSAQGFAGPSYFIAKWQSGSWEIVKQFSGPVNTMKSHNNDLIAGGDFNGMYTGNVLQEVNHIAIFSDGNWSELNEGLNGFVMDVLIDGDDIYVAGELASPMTNKFGFVKAQNGNWSDILDDFSFTYNYFSTDTLGYFKKIFEREGFIYLSGQFSCQTGQGIYEHGTNFCRVSNLSSGASGIPFFATAGEITDVVEFQDKIYLAGEFENLTGQPFNHVAFFEPPNSVFNIEDSEVRIYPNPSSDQLLIDASNSTYKIERIKLYSSSGQLVLSKSVQDLGPLIQLELDLSNGTYIVELISDKHVSREKLVVNN